MVTKTTVFEKVTHTFTAENEFLQLPDWVKETKGEEIYAEWERIDKLADSEHPFFSDLFSQKT